MIKKIIWVQDYTTDMHPGGSQITSEYMYEWGKSLGFDIEMMSLYQINTLGESPGKYMSKGDFFILNNIAHLYGHYPEIIKQIINNKEYARYEHDYLWMHNLVPDNIVKKLFHKAKVSIFLSPLHAKTHKDWGIDVPHFLMPSPIDTNMFKQMDSVDRKKDTVAYLGGFTPHKGLENVFEYARENKDKQINLYGWHPSNKDKFDNMPENVSVLPKVPFENVPHILNFHEYFIHMPNWNEPYGRAVMEAYHCGCKLIHNDKIGALSYDWDFSDKDQVRKNVEEYAGNFWMRIHHIMYR